MMRGYTQQQVADLADIQVSVLSKIEPGVIKAPTMTILMRLCRALGIPIQAAYHSITGSPMPEVTDGPVSTLDPDVLVMARRLQGIPTEHRVHLYRVLRAGLGDLYA